MEQEVAIRQAQNLEAKAAIAGVSVQLLSSGEAVFLDNGSTVQQIVHALAGSGLRLTVLTGVPAVAEAVVLQLWS